MRKTLARGFTLVELLIVIALLGVIATIVIAAINPIEQANRATDAGMKADASQLISAIQRYYATHSEYPWMAASCSANGGGALCNPTAGADAELPFTSADNPAIGLCGASGASCKTTSNQGELISSQELQTQFLSKSWNQATAVSSQLLIGKGANASAAVYACWVPKANSNRLNLINSAATNSNKMIDTTAGFTDAGIPTAGTCTKTTDTGWSTGACSECVPE